MKIQKTGDVKTPQIGTSGSAGIDFFIPNDFRTQTIMPGCDCLINSKIRCELPSNVALVAFNKSGIATKKKLQVGACVVDSDYTGEIHLHVFNFSNVPVTLSAGEKLVQFMYIKYPKFEIELVEKLDEKITERNSGGFGSTSRSTKYNNAVYLIKKDSIKESRHGGSYIRHTFRDLYDNNKHYILDVTGFSNKFFKNINVGDIIYDIEIFEIKNKSYINGKRPGKFAGDITTYKNNHQKVGGFTI